jgi:hypothetical protein
MRERCVRRLERAEQQLRDVETMLERIERLGTVDENDDRTGRLVETARGRVDYFKGRMERIHNQDRRIAEDLRRLGQGGCPDCLASDVRLMCRLVESVAAEIADYLAQIRRKEVAARRRAGAAEVVERTASALAALARRPEKSQRQERVLEQAHAVLARAREQLAAGNADKAMGLALEAGDLVAPFTKGADKEMPLEARVDSLRKRIDELRARLDPDTHQAATVLLDKAAEHLGSARELAAKGEDAEGAKRALIAETLVEKAAAHLSVHR